MILTTSCGGGFDLLPPPCLSVCNAVVKVSKSKQPVNKIYRHRHRHKHRRRRRHTRMNMHTRIRDAKSNTREKIEDKGGSKKRSPGKQMNFKIAKKQCKHHNYFRNCSGDLATVK